MAEDDSAIRVGPLRIDLESLPVPEKFHIRHGAFMPTQSRGHGTRPTPQSGGRLVLTRKSLKFKEFKV